MAGRTDVPARVQSADEFVRFADEQRPHLLGAALLMFGTAARAEDVVEATLAQLYRSWPQPDPQRRVLRQLLYSQPDRLVLPWRSNERVELLDEHRDSPSDGILTELASLDDDVRRVVILQRLLELPPERVAAVLETDLSRVHQLAEVGSAALVERGPDRGGEQEDERRLRAKLTAVAREETRFAAGSAVADLRHGRVLVRRGRLRRLLVATVALLAVVLAVARLAPASAPRADEPASATPPVTAPTPTARASCDTTQPYCRLDLLRDWRDEMTRVVRARLDPGGDYFSGYAYSVEGLSATDDFWRGRDGALSLVVVRRGSTDGTRIFLQVATSRPYAVRCGALTQKPCTRQNFLDGYTYNLTETTTAAEGIEVQLSLRDTGVITVVARNTGAGRTLDLNRSDLMALATDERLRLPTR